MEKRISYDQFMAVKRVAQAVNPLITKRNKAKEAMDKAQADYDSFNAQVEGLQSGIKQYVGFDVEQLVKKVIEPAVNEDGTPKTDKNGKALKVTKYVPTDIVSYDKENRQYIITVPDAEKPKEEVENTEDAKPVADNNEAA